MAYRFDGSCALKYPQPTVEFRYDVGISGGHHGFAFWIKPEIVTTNQEIISICNNVGGPAAVAPCYIAIRLSGADSPGSLLVIMGATAFNFCTVRRSNSGLLAVGVYSHISVLFGVTGGMNDCTIYKDGVQISYAFSRSESGLPPQGGGDLYLGQAAYNDGHPTAIRVVSGDSTNPDVSKRYTTSIGGFFRGSLGLVGFWNAGEIQADVAVHTPSIADGYCPLFYAGYIENSTQSKALMMHMPLICADPTDDKEAFTGITPSKIGSGTITFDDELSALWPSPPHESGPGPKKAGHPRLCLPFGLPRAELYPNPGNPADILPLVYGDFREGGLSGPCPSVLIDRRNQAAVPPVDRWTYCAAYHAVVSIEKIYIKDIEQRFSLDTDNPDANIVVSISTNFQNAGTIASISFLPDASNQMLSSDGQPLGDVSWRGRGLHDPTAPDNDLAVMDNVIDQIVDLLTIWGDFDLEVDFDPTSLAEARSRVELMGYLTAFVVNNEQVTQDWITEMLFNVMGYWRINGRQQAEFHIDDGSGFNFSV